MLPAPEPEAAMPANEQRFFVARHELQRTRLGADPDGPASRAIAEGEARLAIDSFALTANNVTYAAFGDTMKYWDFFPSGHKEWGCVPVWGFAVVCESRAAGVEVGQRLYGYLPMGSHLVVQPGRIHPAGFSDAAAHRQALPAIYNQLSRCDADPGYRPDQEAQQAVLRPLFMTSFLIDDFLADAGFFGARQVLLSSASSKTAYGTAFCLAQRRSQPGAASVVGLTSPANLDFTRSLGCYDSVLGYGELTTLDAAQPTVFVDFAGNAGLRREVHEHFADALMYSCSVGGTHWEAMGGAADLPGPRPTLFFAPAQAKKRSAPPPEGWGPAGLQQRIATAWRAFMQPVKDPQQPWLRVHSAQGSAAVQAAWQAVLQGQGDPRSGLMLSM
jgi:Protein of unknown function (DUF2855)